MKSIAQLILLTLLLAACAAPPADSPAITRTATPSATPTPKNTSTAPRASLTPALDLKPDKSKPETPTITPLPTIPTFTPTFDVRTIVTATPAPRAECRADENLQFTRPTKHPTAYRINDKQAILDFLAAGGDVSKIYNAYHSDFYTEDWVHLVDLTNDGIPELIWSANNGYDGGGDVYGCNPKTLRYEWLFQPQPFNLDEIYSLVGVEDMNLNGMPDVVIESTGCMGYACTAIFIIEWDGEKFRNLVLEDVGHEHEQIQWVAASRVTKIELVDIDNNGTTELIWTGGVQWPLVNIKSYYRYETFIYSWNGISFSPLEVRYSAPVYRFQAVSDGDQATLSGQYKMAITLYHDVIFNAELDSWSREREMQIGARLEALHGTATPTAFPEDLTEYPRLAAYAYYRMVILHTFLGEMEAAQVKYATLQEKFPADSPGHPYVEMATHFWDAYQSSSKMYDACAAAIAYADTHPEILIPLGSDYHSRQSHRYQPADVCPFR